MILELKKRTYAGELKRVVMEHPERPFLCSETQCMTFFRFKERVMNLAAQLKKAGIRPGDHVALRSFNTPEWCVAYMAVICAGGVAILMNYGLYEQDAAGMLRYAKVKAVLYGTCKATLRNPEKILEEARYAGIPKNLTLNIEKEVNIPVAPSDLNEIQLFAEKDDPDRTTTIIFTSGSTSDPKYVMLSQNALLNNVSFLNHNTLFDGAQKILLAVPLYHSYGLLMFDLAFLSGNTLFLDSRLTVESLLQTIRKEQITMIISVNTLYSAMIAHPDFSEKNVRSVRMCLTGGGFTPPEQFRKQEKAFPNAIFFNGYGLTEAAPCLSFPRETDSLESRSNTVGHPVSYVTIRIANMRGDFLAQGRVGEILAKGYNLTNGYWNTDGEDQPIDHDGWLHTGDLGYINENGCLVLCGRIKDIIIRAGENISPLEVEKEILQYSGIRDVKVFGVNDARLGERVQCCITIEKTPEIRESEVKRFLKRRLPVYKIPENFVVFEEFPLLENGKIDLQTLKLDMLERIRKPQA